MIEIPPEGYALLDAISNGESKGSYNVIYGGQKFDSYTDHPRIAVKITSGPNKGKYSSAAGKYQFVKKTWDEIKPVAGVKDFTPDSQDRAAWALAVRDYKAATGRDLLKALQSGDPAQMKKVGKVLSHTWTSLPHGIESTVSSHGFTELYNSKLSERAGHPVPPRGIPNGNVETAVGTLLDVTRPAGQVTVRKGDTLGKIAKANGVDVKTLVDLNAIANPNQLKVGQNIKLPGGALPAREKIAGGVANTVANQAHVGAKASADGEVSFSNHGADAWEPSTAAPLQKTRSAGGPVQLQTLLPSAMNPDWLDAKTRDVQGSGNGTVVAGANQKASGKLDLNKLVAKPVASAATSAKSGASSQVSVGSQKAVTVPAPSMGGFIPVPPGGRPSTVDLPATVKPPTQKVGPASPIKTQASVGVGAGSEGSASILKANASAGTATWTPTANATVNLNKIVAKVQPSAASVGVAAASAGRMSLATSKTVNPAAVVAAGRPAVDTAHQVLATVGVGAGSGVAKAITLGLQKPLPAPAPLTEGVKPTAQAPAVTAVPTKTGGFGFHIDLGSIGETLKQGIDTVKAGGGQLLEQGGKTIAIAKQQAIDHIIGTTAGRTQFIDPMIAKLFTAQPYGQAEANRSARVAETDKRLAAAAAAQGKPAPATSDSGDQRGQNAMRASGMIDKFGMVK